jgi:hypothetical protein
MAYSKAYKEAQGKLQELYAAMGKLTPAQLAKLENEIKTLSKSRGWWLMYEARPMLLEAIKIVGELNVEDIKTKRRNHVSTTTVK